MKAFEATYEYGPHMADSIYVLSKDEYSAKLAVREYLIEESLWERVGNGKYLSLIEVSEIPANKQFIY